MQQAEQQQQQLQQNGNLNTSDIAGPSGLQSAGGAYAQAAAAAGAAGAAGGKRSVISGGRFDFEDGGTYCGGWDEGKAHGHGVCTGPKHQGAYAGAWNYGFEVSGSYIWPSGSHYEGQWQNGRRHGLGVEQIGRQIYRGEWSKDGHKGRYGVRESTVSTAKYEGTWNNGYQDGYGVETYADGGKYQGQWQEGKRHGYGIRTSAPFGLASHQRRKHIHASMSSLRSNENASDAERRNAKTEDIRGGFVLTTKSDKLPARRNSVTDKTKKGFFMFKKMRSTGDLAKPGTLASGSIRSTMSTASWLSTGSEQSNLTAKSAHTESNASFNMDEDQLDPTVIETYMGEWKKDKRCGYGVAERSDGLKYEGEWYNNKKQGYGVTTFRDGTVEEGKYKNNILISSQKKTHLFLARSRKFTERITASVSSAQRALKMAMQRSDIAISRTATAAAKAQNADIAAEQARTDCDLAVQMAREFAPDFKTTVLERFEKLRYRERFRTAMNNPPPNHLSPTGSGITPLDPYVVVNSTQQRPPQISYQPNQQPRRPSHSQTRQESEFPVPSSMYSQQLPVSPQTDLSSLVTSDQSGYGSSINDINQIYLRQQQQQMQQQIQQQQIQQIQQQEFAAAAAQAQAQAQHNNVQMNPAYPYQQTQPPTGWRQQQQPTSNASPHHMQVQQENTMFREAEAIHTAQNNLQKQQQSALFQQQQQMPPSLNASPNHTAVALNQSMRRPSQQPSTLANDVNARKPPMLGQTAQQSSIDHFDHYKRPPSRDSSIDRYARAASRMSGGGFGSRQASMDRVSGNNATTTDAVNGTPENRARAGSIQRGTTPVPNSSTGNGSLPTGRLSRAATPSLGVTGRMGSASGMEPKYSSPQQPFEDVLLRQRTLGQDIIPSPMQPKRTESLYLPAKPLTPVAVGGAAGGAKKGLKSVPITVTLQRKKSLPDFQELPRATEAMSREEVSALGSARREAVRRQIEVNERLKANPLLYLVSPQVKDWFSQKQLVLLVLFVNIVLAILFFKMLT